MQPTTAKGPARAGRILTFPLFDEGDLRHDRVADVIGDTPDGRIFVLLTLTADELDALCASGEATADLEPEEDHDDGADDEDDDPAEDADPKEHDDPRELNGDEADHSGGSIFGGAMSTFTGERTTVDSDAAAWAGLAEASPYRQQGATSGRAAR